VETADNEQPSGEDKFYCNENADVALVAIPRIGEEERDGLVVIKVNQKVTN